MEPPSGAAGVRVKNNHTKLDIIDLIRLELGCARKLIESADKSETLYGKLLYLAKAAEYLKRANDRRPNKSSGRQ